LLAHGAKSPTRDIDTYEGDPSVLDAAIAAVRAELGFAVPINRAAVADLPLNFEDRQIQPLAHLRRLKIFVPDRYDLVLSKLIRSVEPDLLVCREMHEHKPLDPAELVRRYVNEMRYAIGRREDHDHNFVAGVEFIWDADTAVRAQQTVGQTRARSAASAVPTVPRGRGRGR
jgi:hypothetical protein